MVFSRWGRVKYWKRKGASTAEYALILALVVIILIGTLTQLGQALTTKLQGIINEINNAR